MVEDGPYSLPNTFCEFAKNVMSRLHKVHDELGYLQNRDLSKVRPSPTFNSKIFMMHTFVLRNAMHLNVHYE